MDAKFDDEEEKLYRSINPMHFEPDGSISSAAFRHKGGCSVDRGSGRTNAEAVDFLRRCGRKHKIYHIRVKDCIAKNILVKYAPLKENPYHSELFKDASLAMLTRSQGYYLAHAAMPAEE